MLKTSVINVALRGVTQGSKFLLLLYIASRLSPAYLGVYGLVAVTIAISLYLVGMDFYVFNTREILARPEDDRTPLIRNQAVFHLMAYTVVLPLLLTVFLCGLISWKYAGWFYLLLILEHISQESGRLLITLSRPTRASIVLFLRSGIWVYAVLATTFFTKTELSLPLIWGFWSVGGFLSIALAVISLRGLNWKLASDMGIDWKWLKSGMVGSLPFFGSTLALLGIQYADRYFLQFFHGEEQVGIYIFFANIANMIQVFVFTGIIMILYPKIVEAYQNDRLGRYSSLMRKMSFGIVGGSVTLSVAAVLGIRLALKLVNKEIYAAHIDIFWIMLISVALLTASYIPHYALYVRRKDKMIIGATCTALGVGLAANALLVPGYGVQGAVWSTLTAMAALIVVKSVCLLRIKSQERQETDYSTQVETRSATNVPESVTDRATAYNGVKIGIRE